MHPKDTVLGRLPGLQGYKSLTDRPQAETVPGLLLYRFSGNLVFFNIDYFCERVGGNPACRDALRMDDR